jgi:hypothetical protein
MGDKKQGIWPDKIGNSLLVEHETGIAVMTELKIMSSNCPYSKPVQTLRVVGDLFIICSTFGKKLI